MNQEMGTDLFPRLSSAVEEIQRQIARGYSVIWNCNAVDELCFSMEDIFNHGLKEGLLSWASNNQVSFWSLATKITCKKDIEDINRLRLRSDQEKCMAWIRQGLKENTLGSYLNVITQDEKLLKEFYHPHAFLCDREKAERTKNLIIYGVAHLDFDISLTSSSRRIVEEEEATTPLIATTVDMLTHVPAKSSLVNGFGSPSSSWNGREHAVHLYNQQCGNSTSDRTGKKKKKRKKAEVAMIAESVDGDESYYFDKQIETHRELDSEGSDKEVKDITDLNGGHDHSPGRGKTEHTSASALDTEGDTGSEISLQMELPVTETVLEQIITDKRQQQSPSSSDSGSDQVISNEVVFQKGTLGVRSLVLDDDVCNENKAIMDSMVSAVDESSRKNDLKTGVHDDDVCDENKAIMDSMASAVDGSSRKNDLKTGVHDDDVCTENKTIMDSMASAVDGSSRKNDLTTGEIRKVFDEQISEQSSESMPNLVEDRKSMNQPALESQSAPQSSSEALLEREIDIASNEMVEEKTLTAANNTETPEYYAALAAFECGTPKQVGSIWEIERSGEANVTYEGEDLNIIPGIHKSHDTRSRSSSGSFNGSGSFQQGLHRGSRLSTMDSNYRTPSFGSDAPSSSWPGGSTLSSCKSSRTDVTIGSPGSESQFSEYEMFDELLGLEEDHFSPPESFMGVSTSEELQHAISSCKDLINTTPDDSEEKKKLITKLVQLRLKLQEAQDSKSSVDSSVQKVLGHTFSKEEDRGRKLSCDRCGKTIWMWQSLFTCTTCKYHSHRRCLELIRRPCASRKVSVTTYNLSICPEPGLSSQQYKCAECRKQIGLTRGERSEARLCDYSGQYFCEECHWNDLVVIPARVVHNWDFSLYKVSRQSKQLLALMIERPLLKIERLNSALFKFVVELREVKRLREEILIMKKYFVTCRQALESKLLLQLKDRQHFVDSSNIYSLQDLIDVNSGLLLPFLTKIHSLFLTHIKSDCQLCQAKGFVCEFCGKDEIIFAFDPHATQCKQCRTVFHKNCFKSGVCPKCKRRQKRSQTT